MHTTRSREPRRPSPDTASWCTMRSWKVSQTMRVPLPLRPEGLSRSSSARPPRPKTSRPLRLSSRPRPRKPFRRSPLFPRDRTRLHLGVAGAQKRHPPPHGRERGRRTTRRARRPRRASRRAHRSRRRRDRAARPRRRPRQTPRSRKPPRDRRRPRRRRASGAPRDRGRHRRPRSAPRGSARPPRGRRPSLAPLPNRTCWRRSRPRPHDSGGAGSSGSDGRPCQHPPVEYRGNRLPRAHCAGQTVAAAARQSDTVSI